MQTGIGMGEFLWVQRKEETMQKGWGRSLRRSSSTEMVGF
jgi:hypothetical protein